MSPIGSLPIIACLLLPQGAPVTTSSEPSSTLAAPAVTANGLFRSQHHHDLRLSPRGDMRLMLSEPRGDIHELKFDLTVELADGRRANLGTRSGNGFIATDVERVVVIDAHESNRHPALLEVLDLSGETLFALRLLSFSSPRLSADGTLLCYRSAGAIETFDLVSLERRRFPDQAQFTATGDGQFLGADALQPSVVTRWDSAGNLNRLRLREIPRRLALRGDFAPALALFNDELIELDFEDGTQRTLYRAQPGFELRDLRVTPRGIHLGRRQVMGSVTRGSVLTITALGTHLSSPVSASLPIPPSSLIASPLTGIPWPIGPSLSNPIGNSYGEYQNYGGLPYMHPGLDVLGADLQPVYAVRGGEVKAILTTSGDYHWRVAIGNAPGPGSSKGYLYAHIDPATFAVDVGDFVTAGQYLGDLVPWPVPGFTHTHFARIEDSGVVWNGDWLCTDNPQPDLMPQTDTSAPVFQSAIGSDPFAFCLNETSLYRDPEALSGQLDIIVRVSDVIDAGAWRCAVQELRYSIHPVGAPQAPLVDDKLAVRFDMALDTYQGGPIDPFLVDLFYKQDNTCPTEGDYGSREFYHILTNSNGDEIYDSVDVAEAWDTTVLPDGDYRIEVTAIDAAGNASQSSMVVTTSNGNP